MLGITAISKSRTTAPGEAVEELRPFWRLESDNPMTDTRETADAFRELAKKNYAYVMVRMNKSEVREFFDGFLAHVPWVRAVSIEGQEGVKLRLETPWN